MPLVELDAPLAAGDLPQDVSSLIGEARRRIQTFLDVRAQNPIVGFVPSDFELVYAALTSAATAAGTPRGRFLEWGSGFGVVCCLAARLGFAAYGMEIEPVLVEHARRFAADFDVSAQFVCGSFVPPGGERFLDDVDELTCLALGGKNGYELLGFDPCDFDVIFAYPWPGEERFTADLFQQSARPGAVLVTFHGSNHIRIRRNPADRRAARNRREPNPTRDRRRVK